MYIFIKMSSFDMFGSYFIKRQLASAFLSQIASIFVW